MSIVVRMNRPEGPSDGEDGLGDWATMPAYGHTPQRPSDEGDPRSAEDRTELFGRTDDPEWPPPSSSFATDRTQIMRSPSYEPREEPRVRREPPPGYVVRPQQVAPPRNPAPQGYAPPQGYGPPRGYAPPGQVPPPGYRPPPGAQPLGQPPTPRRRKPRWGKRIGLAFLAIVVLILGFAVYLDFNLTRVDALADYSGRPAETPGTDWLLVGSDSREDLSTKQQSELATGFAKGKRTDTIILVHVPPGDAPPTLVSLPRDSLVSLEGHGQQKLNAAYAFGGPQLLVRTVEGLTNIRIDRYAEIGLAGFASMVDAVGGVHVCLDEPINDPKAGINLPAGCQDLDGPKALGYVRTRATARADLDRVVRQRQLLSILVGKATSFGTLANPIKSVPFALAATGSFAVDDGAHLWHLAGLGLALGDAKLVTTTVPIASTPTIDGVGSVVEWNDEGATKLFAALRADKPVPADLVSK